MIPKRTKATTTGINTLLWRDVEVLVETGPDAGTKARLDDGPLLVGTAEECNLRLTDATVSARHCELRRHGDSVVVRDLDSTNGVILDGVKVLEGFPNSAGSRLRLGDTQLLLEQSPEREVVISRKSQFGPMYGQSGVMRALFAHLEAVAQSPAPLLFDGETGTGKDLTARAVHQASARHAGPFVLFDCGAVSPALLEAELFGYEKGAYTGAVGAREGLAEAADGGTLVLDEIGELPLELQPKLLRLVERHEVRRVGGNDVRTVDVRIIACTHRSLEARVKEGTFREDLFYRLSALRVRLPSLRERLEDLPGLVDQLLASRNTKLRFADLPESTQALLRHHQWPGNVRELRNVVERLMVFPGDHEALQLVARSGGAAAASTDASADDDSAPFAELSEARQQALDDFENRYLRSLIARAGGSISEGARIAGTARQYLQRLLRKHGLR